MRTTKISNVIDKVLGVDPSELTDSQYSEMESAIKEDDFNRLHQLGYNVRLAKGSWGPVYTATEIGRIPNEKPSSTMAYAMEREKNRGPSKPKKYCATLSHEELVGFADILNRYEGTTITTAEMSRALDKMVYWVDRFLY